ncbi:MAG: AAA family ATPase [Nanoarchaeota archaeon]|mgnify:CR=1 FL=1
MGLFEGMLKDDESVFLNPEHLDFDYQPKQIKHREEHQQVIATCIKPLLNRRNGSNLLVYGQPGVGKTVSIKHVIQELKQTTDKVRLIYINCWKKETAYRVCLGICEQIGYSWTQDKNTEELIKKISEILNKDSAVIVFDEFDKLEDHNVVYNLIESIYRKTFILISNDREVIQDIDSRVRSRLPLKELEFAKYTAGQTRDILEQRKNYAFVKGVFSEGAFNTIVDTTIKTGDIRFGLHLLREAGNCAECRASRIIEEKDAREALRSINSFIINKETQLKDSEKEILKLIKDHPGNSTRDLFEFYTGDKSYRTFQRILYDLVEARIISSEGKILEHGGKTNTYFFGIKQ